MPKATATTQGRGNRLISASPSGKSQARIYQELRSTKECATFVRKPVCEFSARAKSHGQIALPEIADCSTMIVINSAATMLAIHKAPRRFRLPEAIHQAIAITTENGTKDSFASAPNTPQTGSSAQRSRNMLATIAIRKQASAASTSPASCKFAIAKLRRYSAAPNNATEVLGSCAEPILNVTYAVMATNIAFTTRKENVSGSHVPVCPCANRFTARASSGVRTRNRK